MFFITNFVFKIKISDTFWIFYRHLFLLFHFLSVWYPIFTCNHLSFFQLTLIELALYSPPHRKSI